MHREQAKDRRWFLEKMMAMGALSSMLPSVVVAAPELLTERPGAGEGFTVLFQGDSITDGNRGRNNDWNHVMGHGYAYIIASRLWYEHPQKKFKFFNRGISGNKLPELAARWQKDTIDLKPDLLSILVGVNDASAAIGGNRQFTVEKYEADFRVLLQQTKQALPQVQFVLCEPFILEVGRVKNEYARYLADIRQRQEVVKRLAGEFDAVHVEFQHSFNKALEKAPADYWIWDGIHPMPAGHELMAREWIRRVSRKFRFLR